jgi:peptide/nickel transport system ATP-binding protein
MSEASVLDVRDLTVAIGAAQVVDGVSFSIAPGETLALVGESGCGKSLTALGLIGLLPDAAARTRGEILFDGQDIARLSERQMSRLRGGRMGMIFQEPVASLDPLMPVGRQITEALTLAGAGQGARARAVEMLDRVGIPEPEMRFSQYPFELSGGMCQRVMIAIAMIRNPALLIADEPTTALDVTIQAQILRLMADLRAETRAAVLLITHDMGVVAEVADRIAVMYAGRIVETGPVRAVLRAPRHPYTALLLKTIPRLTGARKVALPAIEGTVPDIADWPRGCRFHPRCPLASDKCRFEAPPLAPAGDTAAACWHSEDVETMV